MIVAFNITTYLKLYFSLKPKINSHSNSSVSFVFQVASEVRERYAFRRIMNEGFFVFLACFSVIPHSSLKCQHVCQSFSQDSGLSLTTTWMGIMFSKPYTYQRDTEIEKHEYIFKLHCLPCTKAKQCPMWWRCAAFSDKP